MSIFSYLALNYCLSLFCFSTVILSLISRFLRIYSCAFTRYSCSAISLLIVYDILFQSLFWKSPCIVRSRFCMFYVTLSLWTRSWFIVYLSFTRQWPSVSKLFYAVCKRSIILSPNSLKTSLPLLVLCPINAIFFYEFDNLCSNSCNLS